MKSESKSTPPTGASTAYDSGTKWFCVHCQPKHEHIAAAHLRKLEGVEVYCPRIRFKRVTRQGPAWVTEAMFPTYIFSRFEFETMNRLVSYSQGVRNILRFGQRYAVIENDVIKNLQQHTDSAEVVVADYRLVPGDGVRIVQGIFKGLDGVVTQILPAKERVKVLLEFLGRTMEVEIKQPAVLSEMGHPLAA